MKHIFILILLFCIKPGYSQADFDYDLKLDFYGMLKNYQIELLREQDKNQIIARKVKDKKPFSKRDSLRLNELLSNPIKAQREEIGVLIEKYKEYDSDTLEIKNDDSFLNIADSFVDKWDVMSNALKSYPDKRIVLDGYTVKISLINKEGDEKTLYAINPSAGGYPEMYELITALEDTYLNESKNPIIN